jgi:hypothetical protein
MNLNESRNQKILGVNGFDWWEEIQKNSDNRASKEDGYRKKGEACPIRNCQRKVANRGLCGPHYQRLKNNGNLQADRPINCKTGSYNPKWKGGEIKIHDNRTLIYTPNHPYPSHSGGSHVLRYRLVMENHLGRYLLPNEIIHHKNGDCTGDSIENLEVMTQSQHATLHKTCGQWSRKHKNCIQCGTTSCKHVRHGLCDNCSHRKRAKCKSK